MSESEQLQAGEDATRQIIYRVDQLYRYCPSEEDNTRVCVVNIDLPLPLPTSEDVIQAAGVEEVAE